MKVLRFLIFVCITLVCDMLNAQSQRELSNLMRERGEYYFSLNVNKSDEIQKIGKICSIDATDGKTVIAYANQKEYEELLKAGFKPELQTPPSLRANVTMWNGQGTYNWDSYLTYPQYVSMMEGFPSQAITGRSCTLFSLGTLSTSNHRQLLGVRINNGNPEGKPKFLYSSTMHGDEITGMIIMLRLINELCTSTDSQIADLVENLDIYILPLTNPDGTYKGGNSTVNSAQRYNGNNIDLNRNYKDYYQGAHPDGNSYEDETIWTMAMGDENLFTMSANYHGGAEVMNYPWDATYDDHADMSWYEYVCTKYVQVARQTYSSYMSDTYSDGVTNGAEWYVITGSRQDYMNAYAQCREVTVECSSTKTPSASLLPSYWNYNRNAMLAFMEQCLKGVHGFVYDAVTGVAIEGVRVTVENHDSETSFVTTHSAGDFHRPIKGGTYTFTFSKQGYYPQSVQVTVADDQRVELNDIQLEPNLNLDPDFTASTTNVALGQSISFTDTSEGTVYSWNWTFEGATPSTSTAQNPTGITYNTPGDYDVTLTVTGPGGTETVYKENYIHVTESIIMQNGTVTTCGGIFYDSGGANSNYGNNLNYTMTFYPGTTGAMMSVNFTQFNTESGYDYLYIYDGTSTDATQIGRYDGTTSPGTVIATNSEGALTFKFTSDSGVNAAGWTATVSCVVPERTITATANIAEGGTVEGDGVYIVGETCTLTATAAENYQFTHWTENGNVVSTNAIYSFQVTADRDLVAVFTSTIPVNITVSANPSKGGTVSGGGEFLAGETCTVVATPKNGYTFMGWTENENTVSNLLEYSFIVNNDRNLVANFSLITEVEIGQHTTNNNYLPSYSYYKQALTQQIYTAEEIGTAGTITSIAFYNAGAERTRNYDFYMKATEKSSFSSKTDWITMAETDKVFSGEVTMTANAWTTIIFDTPFVYDGTSNLVLVADDNTGSYENSPYMSCSVFNTTTNQAIYYYDDNTNFNPLSPPTSSGSYGGWGGNTYNAVLSVKNHIRLGIDLSKQQTIVLAAGWNWWSPSVDITLAELKEALVETFGNTNIMIKSKNNNTFYNGLKWRGTLQSLDMTQMYMIEVSSTGSFTMTGIAIDPAENPITIKHGVNWIVYPLSEDMSLSNAFSAFGPQIGDVVKSKSGTATYNGSSWRGNFNRLEPGQGYIYKSVSEEDKVLVFPSDK